MRFTPEQLQAIERRKGDLLLDAGAGSGKTTVLVERFARAVQEDGVDVGAILTITFTEKAAAELRERIRTRLRAVGDDTAAFATEGAWISTIHAFCARVLRAHALLVGLDPDFRVLDAQEAAQLQDAALEAALGQLARDEEAAELIAAHGPLALRTAITQTYAELRARGQLHPQLPPSTSPATAQANFARSPERTRMEVIELAAVVRRELHGVSDPGKQVLAGLAAVERAPRVLTGGVPWPGELDSIKLPAGTARALRTDVCERYRASLEELRAQVIDEHAQDARDTLDRLLRAYDERYTELKRQRSCVDFEDLELLAREVLRRRDVGRQYRERFARVMVDEMQDTNRVQLELIDLVAGVDLFMVGDAQQSIYGFRYADVELFEERGRKLEQIGARASLQTNFRSRGEILTAINHAFESELGTAFRPLLPGREDEHADEPLVEVVLVDKEAVNTTDDPDLLAAAGGSTIWRLAEARALAARLDELVGSGEATPGEIVVLTRATTDIHLFERALAEAGLPTYVIGGRGYWQQPQVIQLLCYLRALVNPLDREAWLTTLLSPVCALSLDGLVLVAAGAREELAEPDAEALARFEQWFEGERVSALRLGAEAMIDRALSLSGYDAVVARLPDGRRRLANIRKLMRLAREWEAAHGVDLRGFLDMIRVRAGADDAARESEAPVESESLDAIRLMTIHRSKGLEFPVVCVADLGRGQTNTGGLIRISRDGQRLGLQIRRPGSGERLNALWYDELREEQREVEAAEERRLFYVAVTRAQERLIISGAGTFHDWHEANRQAPIGWVGAGFVSNIDLRAGASTAVASAVGAHDGSPPFTTELGVRVNFVARVPSRPTPLALEVEHSPNGRADPVSELPPLPATPHAPLATLSYSALASYEKCGYRFYAEHVARLPQPPEAALRPPREPAAAGDQQELLPPPPPMLAPAQAAARGTEVHRILASLDFRHPITPLGTPPDVRPLLAQFTASPMVNRLAGIDDVRREQRFAFGFRGTLITGTFDVIARDPRTGGALVIDYKSDRIGDSDPVVLTQRHYLAQRVVYALAALKTGVPGVEVYHLFLERADEPVLAVYTTADVAALEADLAKRIAGPLAGDFRVTPTPGRTTCFGCPARAGLCSWPLAMTLR